MVGKEETIENTVTATLLKIKFHLHYKKKQNSKNSRLQFIRTLLTAQEFS